MILKLMFQENPFECRHNINDEYSFTCARIKKKNEQNRGRISCKTPTGTNHMKQFYRLNIVI